MGIIVFDSMNVFNNEECILINNICKNENLKKLTKEDVMSSLLFSRQVVDEDNDMMVNLVESTYEKVMKLSEAEWDKLKMLVPLKTVGAEVLSA